MIRLNNPSHKKELSMTKGSNKKRVLINGYGQSKFYFGTDATSDEPVVGIEHPDSNTIIFISGPVLAQMNGWIARIRKDLKPTIIN